MDLQTTEYDKKDEERTEEAQTVEFTLVKLKGEMKGIYEAFFFNNQNQVFQDSIWVEEKDESFNLSALSEQLSQNYPD